MARSGRFGRLPRTAPSLASVVVALTREMNAQIDQNMVDAWNEGGEVDGQKITDEKLLAHLKMRRDNIDTNDPLWDEMNNLYLDYSFSIEESKMSLSYAEGKTTDLQMATFYTTWANKLPHDSEAYRNLARSAAQFREAATQRAAGAGRAARQDAYDTQRQVAYDRYQRDYDAADYWLTRAAIEARLINPDQTIDDIRYASGPDQALFYDLFDQIATSPDFAYVRNGLAQAGLAGMSYGTFMDLSSQWTTGQRQLLGLAVQFGETKDAEGYRQELTDFTSAQMQYQDLDEMAAYALAREDFLAVFNDPSATAYMLNGAMDDYARQLRIQYGTATSDDTKLMLSRELSALDGNAPTGPGQITAAEEGGVLSYDEGRVGDADGTAYERNKARDTIARLTSGEAVLQQVERDVNGVKVKVYEPIPTAGNPMLNDADAGMVVAVPMGRGQVASVWVPFMPIFSEARADIDPNTGRPITTLKPIGDTQVGVYYILNGKTYYGIYHDQGQLTFTTTNPFVAPGQNLNIKIDEQGAMQVQWDSPLATPGAEGLPQDQYDAFSVVVETMFDESIRDGKYDSGLRAAMQEDDEIRDSILMQSSQEVAGQMENRFGAGSYMAQLAMQEWVDVRNEAGIDKQREWDMAHAAERYSVRGGAQEFADRGPGWNVPTINLLAPTVGAEDREAEQIRGMKRTAAATMTPEEREMAARTRAARMVAEARFNREQSEYAHTLLTPQGIGNERPGTSRYVDLLVAARKEAAGKPVISLPGMSMSALEEWVRAQGAFPQPPTQPGGGAGHHPPAGWKPRPPGRGYVPELTVPAVAAPLSTPVAPRNPIKPYVPPTDPRDLGENRDIEPYKPPKVPKSKTRGFLEY